MIMVTHQHRSNVYSTLKSITKSGKTAVLVVAGNHDNRERLVAASPLSYKHGVILLGEPKSIARQGNFGGESL